MLRRAQRDKNTCPWKIVKRVRGALVANQAVHIFFVHNGGELNGFIDNCDL